MHTRCLADIVCPPVPTDFGPWLFSLRTLRLKHRGTGYLIHLVDIDTSARMLDVVMQVAQKTWGTADTVGWLVQALRRLLQPQAHFCSLGREHGPADVHRILRRRFGRE